MGDQYGEAEGKARNSLANAFGPKDDEESAKRRLAKKQLAREAASADVYQDIGSAIRKRQQENQ